VTAVSVGTRGDSRQLRQLQLFRHEMQHVVRVLHEYIANEVITVSWHEFEADLGRHLAGLNDLHQRHLDYLHKCQFRSEPCAYCTTQLGKLCPTRSIYAAACHPGLNNFVHSVVVHAFHRGGASCLLSAPAPSNVHTVGVDHFSYPTRSQ